MSMIIFVTSRKWSRKRVKKDEKEMQKKSKKLPKGK